MKKCTTRGCDVPVELQEFNKNKSRKDGLNTICKVCSRRRSKLYYKDNPTKHKQNVLERNRKNKGILRLQLIQYFIEHPCSDCGIKDLRVLEFDHLRDKEFNISDMVTQSYSWKRILKEIEKCEVVCKNCHAIRTAIRQNSYRNIYGELA